jgi:chemotaxis protein methyltransferase CheR
MKDVECVAFLQWALPRLGLQWAGYRRVHRQVCKRVCRRIQTLKLSGLAEYTTYLSEHLAEWTALEALCSIPISRFYRDRAVFDLLGDEILPELAKQAISHQLAVVRCWSAGCAAGEEPYTLSLIWDQRVEPSYPQMHLAIVATDVGEHLLERARAACYSWSSLRELPPAWIDRAFDRRNSLYCLREHWKVGIEFRRQDIRLEQPSGEFDLILCRNVAFTYFNDVVQRDVLAHISERLRPDGVLVIGTHESLPLGTCFLPASASCVYRKPRK